MQRNPPLVSEVPDPAPLPPRFRPRRRRDAVGAILSRMMCTSTGSALCDSGGIYGYNYDRNRKNPPRKRPPASLTFNIWGDVPELPGEKWEMSPVLNTWHFLTRALETAPKLQRAFSAFARRPSEKHNCWLETMENWIESREDLTRVCCENTYNLDNVLSQDFQFVHFQDDFADDFVILHTHNGCDIRGGYPRPCVFKLSDDHTFWGVGDFVIYVDDVRGLSWCYSGNRHAAGPEISGPDLVKAGADPETLARLGIEPGARWPHVPELEKFWACTDPVQRGRGVIYVDGNGAGHCPLTGRKLDADFF